jgi:hypothetical protein
MAASRFVRFMVMVSSVRVAAKVGGPPFGLSYMQTMPPMPSLLHENGIGIGIGIGGGGARRVDVKVACDFAKLQMRCVFLNPQSPIMSAGDSLGRLSPLAWPAASLMTEKFGPYPR